jgi:type VI secretion system secreted protein VgrG
MAGMTRLLQAGTPLGAGVLTLQRMAGKEALGRLPEFELGFVSRRGDIKPEEILGKNITWTLELADGAQRYFNGFVTSFADDGESDAGLFEAGGKGTVYLYTATVHPWLWFLTRAANCRIFQNLSVPEIVDQVFKDYKFADTKKVQLRADYPKKEFNVQYRESDFNFVCRLLEQEGIYFAFEYDDGKNTLVLMDSQGAHKVTPALEAPFHHDTAALRDKDCYGSWSAEREIQTGKYVVDEFDWMKPRVAMSGDGLPEVRKPHDLAEFEIYDYPGEYDQPAEGAQYAKTRIEELHTKYETFFGAGNVRRSAPGRLLKLQDHPRRSYNAEYLLTGVNYAATDGSLASGGEVAMFSCNVVAISSKATFRPGRLTPKPIVQGTQSAIVVGPAGEEIYTDEYGRIKVQFHWDRYSKTDENSSCWVRVAQPVAGKEWGFVTLPRIGQEVLVDFLEGDPDHPVVIGTLYNGEAKPPWKLPDEKSRSGFKSKSYKGSGFNELRFEDKAGSEEIYIHAQKDQSALIEHDRIEKIGNESHFIVGKDALEKLGGDHHIEVAGDRNEKLGGGLSLKIGKDMQAKLGTKLAYDAGTEIHLKAGTTLVLEASASLSLKVGGNFISLNPGGVFIKGTMVMLNSGGAAGSGSGASPQPPTAPKEPAASQGGQVTQAPTKQKPTTYSPQAQMFKMAAESGTPFCEVCNC